MEPRTQPKTTRHGKSREVAELPPERLAYTVAAFCRSHAISRAFLYQLWREGRGPRKMAGLGRKILISVESAREWRREMEQHGRDDAA